jgi:hypothetical protein
LATAARTASSEPAGARSSGTGNRTGSIAL